MSIHTCPCCASTDVVLNMETGICKCNICHTVECIQAFINNIGQ